ncbi:hypothetical protein Bhyg_16834, partial [Pseudolycoriella hygida]
MYDVVIGNGFKRDKFNIFHVSFNAVISMW